MPRHPRTFDNVSDWQVGSDLAWNYEQRADAFAELALRTAADAGGGEDDAVLLARAQVYATLALDQRTASQAAAWPGYVDSVNGTLDEAAAHVADRLVVLEAAVDGIRPRPFDAVRRFIANQLRRRPADG